MRDEGTKPEDEEEGGGGARPQAAKDTRRRRRIRAPGMPTPTAAAGRRTPSPPACTWAAGSGAARGRASPRLTCASLLRVCAPLRSLPRLASVSPKPGPRAHSPRPVANQVWVFTQVRSMVLRASPRFRVHQAESVRGGRPQRPSPTSPPSDPGSGWGRSPGRRFERGLSTARRVACFCPRRATAEARTRSAERRLRETRSRKRRDGSASRCQVGVARIEQRLAQLSDELSPGHHPAGFTPKRHVAE